MSESPENGKVTVDEDGNWIYTPNKDFVGKDRFTITVADKAGYEDEILFEIDVEDVPAGNFAVDKELPKTGETSSWIFYIIGGFMVVMGINSFIFGKKKSKPTNN